MRQITFLLTLAASLLAANAFGAQTYQGTPISAVVASSNYDSTAVDASSSLYGSFQCTWAALTGTITGTVQAQIGATSSGPWDSLSGTSLAIVGAADHNSVVVSGVLTAPFVRLHYLKGGISGGTLTCTLSLKE